MLWQKEGNAETITEELSILWLYAAYEQIASSGTICSRKRIYFSFCNYQKDQRLLFLQIFCWGNLSKLLRSWSLSVFINCVHTNTSSGDSPLLREQPHPDSPWQEDLPQQNVAQRAFPRLTPNSYMSPGPLFASGIESSCLLNVLQPNPAAH